MKKILTLFAMLLVTASLLTAQAPKISYQMIVRDQANNLVVKQSVSGTLSILQNGQQNPVLTREFSATTNHNGMLSLDIEAETYAGDYGYDLLDKIDWSQAMIVMNIPAYDIKDTMEVRPVPYALSALKMDIQLSTEQIASYIRRSDNTDVDKIENAYTTNTELEQYVLNRAVEYIKNHKADVKELVLHYLSQITGDDIEEAYDSVMKNTELVDDIIERIVQFAKDHKSQAKQVVLHYINNANSYDVQEVLDAVDGNENYNEIANWLVSQVSAYLKSEEGKAKIIELFKHYYDNASDTDADNFLTYVKENNKPIYTESSKILDDLIQKYLDENNYLKKCVKTVNGEPKAYDLCDILATLENLENNPNFIKCPELGIPIDNIKYPTIFSENSIYLRSTIKNVPENLKLKYYVADKDSIYFLLTYPGTLITTPDTMFAEITHSTDIDNDNIIDTIMSTSMNKDIFNQFYVSKGQVIVVEAVLYSRCTPLSAQRSGYDTLRFPMQCLNVIALENTSPVGALDLYNNGGVKLTGTLDRYYPEMIAHDSLGFIVTYKDFDGTTKNDTLIAANGVDAKTNKFTATLDMSYCSKDVSVKGFVKCTDGVFYESEEAKTLSFHVRGPKLNILSSAPDNTYHAFADSIKLTARNSFTVGDDAHTYCSSLSAGTYTIEQIMSACSSLIADYGITGTPTYHWADSASLADSVYTIAPDSNHAYIGWYEMTWNNATCKVYDTINIKYEPYKCADSIKVGDRVLRHPEVVISSDPSDSTYKTSLGRELILSAAARVTSDTINEKPVFDTVNNIKANHMYNDIIKDYKYNWLRYNVDNDTLRKGQDTLHLTTYKDSNYVAHVAITLSNDTVCHIFDTILVKYQFECGDTLRATAYNYATVPFGSYCWTKSNMRETVAFDGTPILQGAETGGIVNGKMFYYTPSSLLSGTPQQLGLLYNHQAADSVCPAGWHLPTDEEWTAMEVFVDTTKAKLYGESIMSQFTDILHGYNKYLVAGNGAWTGSMYWGNGASLDLFEAYPAGARQRNKLVPGFNNDYGYYLATFWTKTLSTADNTKYYGRAIDPMTTNHTLYGDGTRVIRDDVNKIIGMSVRCVYGPAPDAAPATFECGTSTVTDRDNNTYNTVGIGNQCWMKENLRTSSFADGSAIENGYNKTLTVDQAYYYSFTDYGYHYNWTAVSSDKGLCPEGWIVPSENDFNQLITYLSDNNNCDNNSNNISKALAIDAAWKESGTYCAIGNDVESNNSSKFSAYPAGYICCGNSTTIQNPNDSGVAACFWSSTSRDNDHAYRLYLRHDNANVNGSRDDNYTPKWEAFSVRCIKAEN